MKKHLLFIYTKTTIFFLMLVFSSIIYGQATVFSDAFTTSAGTSYTTSTGAVGSSANWNMTSSGADYGVRINSGVMSLSNDATFSANNNGWVLCSKSTGSFATPYNTTLNANPGLITWTFNMRQQQPNPSGFASGNYGDAFILAGTSGTTNSSGTGYAVILGNTGKTDPLKLVSYSAGLQSTTQILASNTTGLSDFGNAYLSVKVTYTPSTNTWQLYVRSDGTTFLDPTTGSLTSQGTATNSTYTGTVLPIMGALWNSSTKNSQTASFDNIKVTVAVPTIISISPPSKVASTEAFTLTVNGTGFVNGNSTVKWNGGTRTTTFVSATQLTASILSTDITSSGTASITVANGVAISNPLTFIIDPAGVPNISLSTSGLTTMTTITGTASSAQTYTVSGSNLTTDVTVTAPTNFEISTTGVSYSSSLTLTRTGNVLIGQPVTIYARVKSTAPSGLYTATIDHATTGGTTKTIAVTATVIAAKPTTQATSVNFTTVTSTTFTVNWTNGNGANHVVLIRSGGAVNSSPIDGVTYAAISSFGAGSEIGTGNYLIYSGSSNTIGITGLQPNTTYYVAVYDYNGSGGTESYLTTSPTTGNRTTLNAPVGWQIYNTNTVNAITFDTTVDGVNEGVYQSAGLSPTLTSGELNSNAWAITGFSDGAIAFGGTSTDGQDYDRGAASGDVSIGGVYAFDTSTNNYSLGIQPATSDFVPGSITLRFQNQTGATVTSLSIGYKVYVYNDQASSSSINFSNSADNSSYNNVSGLVVTSPGTSDASPTWKAYYRVVTLTGLSIANNNYYYFRWTGATVSGSVDFDEFGLDDIVMVANPSTNYASFSGTAENFTVLGNTNLSGNTTVMSDLTFNGGKLNINGNALTLNGTVTNTTSGGLKVSASSNLTISGAISPSLSFDQTTVGTTNLLNNFSINTTASNTITLLNPVVVNGTLTTALGQTLNLGTNALTGTLTTIINNGNILTQNTTATPIPSGKTWGGTGVLNFNAATQQTLVAGTYNNLTITTAGGAVATASINVNGILNLPTANPSATVGSLSMGTYTLTMGGSATNTGNGDVSGIVTRNSIVATTLYTFGSTYTSIIFPNSGTLPTSMSLKIDLGVAPSWRTGAINRTYDFIQTGGSATKAVIKAHYLDSELNGNAESRLVDWAYINPSNTTLEQGRSNYNTTENWVELTNVNVGLYFAGTFGVVSLTLDESAAGTLIWNGSLSDSWTTAVNWTPNATPSDATAVFIPNATTTPNDPTLNPAVLLGTLEIEAGGILNAPANSQFTINGGAGAWINNGTFNPGTGTSAVIFTGADATIAGSTNFNNLTINSGAGLIPLTENYMSVVGAFTNSGTLFSGAIQNTIEYTGANQTIPSPNGTLHAYNNLIISGTGAVFPSSLDITKNLTLNQSVNFSGKTIALTGTESQIINGTASPTFNNLTIYNLGDVILSNNTTITGTLSLSALLQVGTNTLTLGASAVTGSFDNTKMIVVSPSGQVRRTYTGTGSYTFPIGENSNGLEYSPITVNVTAGTFASAYVGVTVVDAVHPNNSSIANKISRYWNVNQSGITGAVATITSNYVTADLQGTEGDISSAQLNGTFNQATNPWIRYSALASNTLTATGATLTPGQTSAFSGVKGGTYSAVISGYGYFCLNDVVTLVATPTGGDAPYTYLWSGGLGTEDTATPPTSSAGTINYTVTIKDSNGITATDNANVVVAPYTVGGTVSSNQTICSGTQPADLTLSGETGTVVKWQSSNDAAFTSPSDILETSATLNGSTIGSLTANTYFRAVIQSGVCSLGNSSYILITVDATTVAGTVASNQTICSGTIPADLTLSGYTGSIIKWQSSSDAGFTSPIDIVETSATLTGASIGSLIEDMYFRAVIQSGVCNVEESVTVLISVDDAPVGGSIDGGTAICAGSTSGVLTLSGHTGSVVRWEYAVSPFISWATISNTNDTYTSGALTQTTQFRAVIQNGTCPEAFSVATSVDINTTTWSSGVWSNGTPDGTITTTAVIAESYTSTGENINACSLLVNSGATVVISSGDSVTLSGALTATPGSFVTFNNNANLIQTTNVANPYPIIIKRDSSPLYRLDYTLWSSPVALQKLKAFSPGTLNNRFYTYNTATIPENLPAPEIAANTYVVVTNPTTTNFTTAKGYLIRMPNNCAAYVSPSTPGTNWTGSFTGVPNNGDYGFTLVDGGIGQQFNLVGNPYPSPIDAVSFVDNVINAANTTGTLYFLRKTNGSANTSYNSWNESLGYNNESGEAAEDDFFLNKAINVGQGFFVEASGLGNSLVFDNSMRIDNHDNQFFKSSVITTTIERNRIWLRAFNSSGLTSQTLFGYVTNATLSVDKAIDGRDFNDGALAISTLIGTDSFALQGRPLPFNSNDVVPLNFRVTTAGDYTIAIDHVDGLFTGGTQSIYLKDNLTATVHDLNAGAYSFASAAGTFGNRFEIIYALPLGTQNPVLTENNVIVYNNNNEFVVNTGNIIMSSVKVFDIRGRLLQEKKDVNASQTTIGNGLANQVLLVQITSEDGITVTKKVIR